MFEDAGDLITWMRHFPYFYETERQILVHAGIAEWGGKDWLCVTSEELMVGKRTVSRGAFYKDVIAGHISEYMTVSGMTVRVIIISTEPPGGVEKFRCWNMTVKLENTEKYGETRCNAAQ